MIRRTVSVASVLAALFVTSAAAAQDAPPSPNPVEEKEVKASTEDPVAQPAEGSGERASVTAIPATAKKDGDGKWDVSAPGDGVVRQVPIRTDEGT